MRKLIVFYLFITTTSLSLAQDIVIGKIGEEFIKDANVVVRKSVKEFKVVNQGKAIETNHLQLTILNEYGKREAEQYIYYSDLVKLNNYSGKIYDQFGNKVKKIKEKDIRDVSASGSDMYSDARYKILDFTYPSYPYTIVLDYEVVRDGLMYYPRWIPQDDRKASVEYAKFIVHVPEELDLNYYESKVEGSKSKADGMLTYEWEVSNLYAFNSEPYSTAFRDFIPYVYITPKNFEMEGGKGSMSTWKSIGEWSWLLGEGREILPEGAKQEINNKLKGVTDKRDKAKAIYDYVQNTTRYVSVQLGIGGWQPFDATYVYENGYGDCKALTNYTYALMKHAGIESYYTLVNAGRTPDILTDFPNAFFNHAILTVPFEEDTVWLECTSQTNPFGYTGTFTSDRHVLLVTEEGGKLVKTHTYTEDESLLIRKATVQLTKSGNAIVKSETDYSGIQYDNVDRQLYESPEEQKKWLLKKMDLGELKITEFQYKEEEGIVPRITENLELEVKNYASLTGDRIFFNVNPLNKHEVLLKKVKDRKTEVQFKLAFTDIDSIHFILPDGYHVEHLPESRNIKTQFGEYSTQYELSEQGILYVRKWVMWNGTYPAESYEAYRKMLKDVAKEDKTKVVLVGST
ncbi:MAG: DUF3857 domain-containing transglutaminase family protein [Bacteroidota bacterium]